MLIGRDAERVRVEELLDAAASGPVGCILEGMPGIGKTTLCRDCVESARRRGFAVLETAPSEPESVLAFSGLGDLFEHLTDEALATLPEPQAHALKAALSLEDVPDGSRESQALPRAILGLLRELSQAGPVLLAIDDEQWLDPASARVLAFALSRLREEPIAVILARRPEPSGALSAELGRRFNGSGLETIALEPLPMSTLKSLLEARLKRTISHPLLRRIHQAAGGNPFYALAIATELETRHAAGDRADELPIARTLADAIELRLGHLDPRANTAMLAIAALSQPTLGMLQAAIPDFALSDLESAERAGVIDVSGGRLRFTHPLLASTHYANTPASQRREFHRLLATVIDDEEERARHIALGAEAPDRDIADTLERAARVAARRGATESAAQLLEDAARLTPVDQALAWSERTVAAAEHRFNSGEVSRARQMLEDVIPDLTAGPLRGRARLQLGLILGDEPRLAMELLEAALADADEDDLLRIEIEAELPSAACSIGRLQSAKRHAAAAVPSADRLGDPNLVAKTLGSLLVTSVCVGEPLQRDLLARLSAMEDLPGISTYHQPSTAIGLALYWAGDPDGARPLLEQAAKRALARGEEWDRLGVLLALALLEREAGNRQMADLHHQAAEDALGEFAEGHLWLRCVDAARALERGDLSLARKIAADVVAQSDTTGRAWQTARAVPVLSAVELLSGEPEQAHHHLKELRERLVSSGFGPAGSAKADVWSQDVEALVAIGRLDEAEEVLAELRVRAEHCAVAHVDALAARCEGLLLAARGDLIGGIEAMDAALAAHARCQRPFELGRTLLEKGSIERRVKRKAAAKQTLEQALTILEPLDATPWVRRTRDELSRIGLRRARATEGLTAAQGRVAALVADGLSNPQIARELHMSLRTVESHLSRVYREYGVSSRAQLVAAFAASDFRPSESSDGPVRKGPDAAVNGQTGPIRLVS